MSIESLIGIIVTVIVGIVGFFSYTTRKNVNVNQSNESGTQNMKNNTIGNEINIKKDNDKK